MTDKWELGRHKKSMNVKHNHIDRVQTIDVNIGTNVEDFYEQAQESLGSWNQLESLLKD